MRAIKVFLIIATCLLTGVATQSTIAELLLYEGFAADDYTAGGVDGQSYAVTGFEAGGSWISGSDFVAEGLTHPVLPTTPGFHVSRDEGNMEGLLDVSAGGPFEAAGMVGTNGNIGGVGVTNTIYYSVLARKDSGGDGFAGFQTFNGPVGVGIEGFGPGEVGVPNYKWFQGGSNNNIGSGTPIVLDETHFFVVRFDYDEVVASESTIWIDPDIELSETEQAIDISSDVTLNEGGDEGFDRIVMRGGGVNVWSFDEIRFGTTWEDVTPTQSSAAFFITEITRDPGSGAVTLTFESIQDRIYEIDISTNLIDWTLHPENVFGGEGETTQFTDMNPPAGGVAYYRVIDTGEDD